MKNFLTFLLLIIVFIINTKAQVTIYYDCDYLGQSQVIKTPGKYNSSNIKLPNNTISSIKVENGYEVKLFDSEVFYGNTIVFSNSVKCLVDLNFNDVTSSMIVNKKDYTPESNIPYQNKSVVKNLTSENYQQNFNKYVKFGYRPYKVWMNESLTQNDILYNAIFIKNEENIPFASFHGIGLQDFENYVAEYGNKGFALTYVDMDNYKGNLIFCAVFTQVNDIDNWTEKHKLTQQEYDDFKTQQLAAGYIEYNNSKCKYNGQTVYATSWYKPK